MIPSTTTMLRIDSVAGLTWGLLVMGLHTHISAWLGLPVAIVLFQGSANLVYSVYSGTLALRAERSNSQLKFLVLANFLYGVLCLGFLATYFSDLSMMGRVFLFLEFSALASLAGFEYRVFFGSHA